ncbi:MAG: hypothetical protein M3Q59_03600 [Actinomycetota bacterium]|nr:hypothetical protein [Actinomycetota bacterium]
MPLKLLACLASVVHRCVVAEHDAVTVIVAVMLWPGAIASPEETARSSIAPEAGEYVAVHDLPSGNLTGSLTGVWGATVNPEGTAMFAEPRVCVLLPLFISSKPTSVGTCGVRLAGGSIVSMVTL